MGCRPPHQNSGRVLRGLRGGHLVRRAVDEQRRRALEQLAVELVQLERRQLQLEIEETALSNEKDKASNVLNTAALERNTLNGKHTVAEDAYNEYHAGFVDEAETLAKQSKAIVTIGAKIDSAIEQCSAA